MSYYSDDYTEEELKKLEEKIAREYRRAYREMSAKAKEYFETLNTERIQHEYEAYQRGEYTKAEFDLWYQTQVMRGQGYEQMRDDMANQMANANKTASAYINDTTPSIASVNYNYEAYQISEGYGIDFHLSDAQTIKSLMMDENHVEFRTTRTNPQRDYVWNRGQINSALTAGILQGKSIDKLADSFLVVMKRNRASAVRNARTAVTSAQNGGRQASYAQASKMGIQIEKEWISTLDERTRLSHAMRDGKRVPYDKEFASGLMYPADTSGAPAEVYNCRCTMRAIMPNVNEEKRETYADWMDRMANLDSPTPNEQKALQRWNDAQPKNPEFTPAKTKEEAEKYALRFASNVDYKGISLENANIINQTLTELTSKYPISQLQTIDGNTRKGATGSANYSGLHLDGKKVGQDGKTSEAVYRETQEAKASALEMMKQRFKNRTKLPDGIQQNIDNLEKELRYTRWSPSAGTQRVVTHEYGHILADQRIGQINKEKAKADYTSLRNKALVDLVESCYMRAHKDGFIFTVGRYGGTNSHEFFAETFLMREIGEDIPDYVADMLEEVLNNG